MDISVIIPSYKSENYILHCLESLHRQETSASFEIIIVDSSPEDIKFYIISAFPNVKVIHLENQTFPGVARNIGVGESNGRILAFLDADCVADEGWIGDFSPETYEHNLSHNIQGRRPVLLYGDSFGRCNIKPCFQEILNTDPGFSDRHYLLNFSRGNYGVDQIYLTMKYSIDLYDDPIVVFSFMTLDLDRVVLKLRPQQKPYFL